MSKKKILHHQDPLVCRRAIETAMRIFERSKSFPRDETYSLPTKWAARSDLLPPILPKHGVNDAVAFIAKLNDAEGVAAEMQTSY